MRTFVHVLAVAAILFPALLPAQEAPRAHESVRSIRTLDAKRLEKGELVMVEGIVLFAGFIGFTMHDGEFAIQVALERDIPRPVQGERVRVEGVTGTNLPGGFTYPLIVASRLTHLGPGILPKAKETTVRELAGFRDWDQWVAVEGRVIDQSWSNGERHLFLGASDGWAVIHVRNTPRETFSPDLVGARIRATGVNQGFDHTPVNAMMVPDPSHWSVLDPAPRDDAALPLKTFADLNGDDVPVDRLVRIRAGVVHVAGDGQVFLRDEEGSAARLTGFDPLPKPTPSEGERSDLTPLPSLRPGDRIEAVGFSAGGDGDRWLRYARVRVLAPVAEGGAVPGPVQSTVEAVLAGETINQLVTVSGRLLEKTNLPLGPGRHRSVLRLEHEGHLIQARLDSPERDPFASLRIDHLLEVSGILAGNERAEGTLLMRSPQDAISRGLTLSALFRRVWVWGALAVILFGLFALWIGSLRRSLSRVERAEASVRELNATLEDRVRERTSELEGARAELDRALGQERELNALKSRFVAMVSHEFRTPLGVTMSALELLRHHRARLPDAKQGELLDDIFSATLRMSGLMEQILVLGRADSGKMAVNPVPIDLPGLVRRLVEETLASSQRENPVEYDFTGDLDPVTLDESLLRLILGNLISNAVKYSPDKGTIRIKAAREGGQVRVEIADEGIGIPAEDQPHLFEAFHRATNVGEISGTGLGLLLVKRCVGIHQGDISFESEAGRGTTFRVRLPVDPV